MREIKLTHSRPIRFRAWDENVRRMMSWEELGMTFEPLSVEGQIYMQYTGLRDKNGKEIYEGDIVRHRNLDRPEDGVMFGLQETMMGKIPREVKFEGCGFIPLAGWIDDALKDMQWEVIGNIYENPELLK